MVRTVAGLWYQECLVLADDEAREWRLLRVDVPGEDEEPILAAYCPECADREFGLSRGMNSDRSDPRKSEAPHVRIQRPGVIALAHERRETPNLERTPINVRSLGVRRSRSRARLPVTG
jgi:hypothetical protein